MKTIILYYSTHHGNTKKLAEAIAAAATPGNLVDLVDVTQTGIAPGAAARDAGVSDKAAADLTARLADYDLIGLASGIYGGNFAKPILHIAENVLPMGKQVFLLATSAMQLGAHTASVRRALDSRGASVAGEYRCPGFNTFGPFKLVGGTSKGHPTQDEVDGAVRFWKGLTGEKQA